MTGSAEPSPAGAHLLAALAREVGNLPNSVVIEGHTDARPFRNAAPSSGYGNWELSADRANAARRLLHQFGIRPQQVVEVRGFADERLMIENDPDDPPQSPGLSRGEVRGEPVNQPLGSVTVKVLPAPGRLARSTAP